MNDPQRAVAARAASLLLRYPDAETLALVPVAQQAIAELPAWPARCPRWPTTSRPGTRASSRPPMWRRSTSGAAAACT